MKTLALLICLGFVVSCSKKAEKPAEVPQAPIVVASPQPTVAPSATPAPEVKKIEVAKPKAPKTKSAK